MPVQEADLQVEARPLTLRPDGRSLYILRGLTLDAVIAGYASGGAGG